MNLIKYIGELKIKPEVYTKALSINYIGLIPILTKAIQEQQEIIINQNDKIEALEQKVKEILSRIE